jgi:hypothetical protein
MRIGVNLHPGLTQDLHHCLQMAWHALSDLEVTPGDRCGHGKRARFDAIRNNRIRERL